MFPLFLPGDKVEIEDQKDCSTGNIVAYLASGKLIAHRIVYTFPDRKNFITKGDNNLLPDKKIALGEILGKVIAIKRGSTRIALEHLYYTQSSFYLSQLVKVEKSLKRAKIKFIVLRGIVPSLHWAKSPPNRLLADCDIFVREDDFKKVIRVLSPLGFTKSPATLFAKEFTNASEVTLTKNIFPFPVRVDLHRGLGIPFTKLTYLNSLFPKVKEFEQSLFTNSISVKQGSARFKILDKETFVIYLLLHWYRHNYEGLSRIELVKKMTESGLDWKRLFRLSKKYGVPSPVHLGLILSEKYLDLAFPNRKKDYALYLLSLFISPFSTGNRVFQGVKRLLLVFLLSPAGLSLKLRLLLSPKTLRFIPLAIGSFIKTRNQKRKGLISEDYAAHGLNPDSKTKARPSRE